jgi:hypothetical protein
MTTDIPKSLRYLRIPHYLSTHLQATTTDLVRYFDGETSLRNIRAI